MNVVFFQDLFEEVVQDLNSCLCINLHGFRRYVVKSCRFSISFCDNCSVPFCDNCSPDLCLCWYVVVDLQVVIARWYAEASLLYFSKEFYPFRELFLCCCACSRSCLFVNWVHFLNLLCGTLLSSFLVRCFFSPICLVVSVVPFISLGASLYFSICGFVVLLAYAFALLSGLCSEPLSFPSLHPVSSL